MLKIRIFQSTFASYNACLLLQVLSWKKHCTTIFHPILRASRIVYSSNVIASVTIKYLIITLSWKWFLEVLCFLLRWFLSARYQFLANDYFNYFLRKTWRLLISSLYKNSLKWSYKSNANFFPKTHFLSHFFFFINLNMAIFILAACMRWRVVLYAGFLVTGNWHTKLHLGGK